MGQKPDRRDAPPGPSATVSLSQPPGGFNTPADFSSRTTNQAHPRRILRDPMTSKTRRGASAHDTHIGATHRKVAAIHDTIPDISDRFGEAYARQAGDPTFEVGFLGARLSSALRHEQNEQRRLEEEAEGDRAYIAKLEDRLAAIETAPGFDLVSLRRGHEWFRDELRGLADDGITDSDGAFGDAYLDRYGDEPLAVWVAAAQGHAVSRRIREHRLDQAAAAIARRRRIAELEARLAESDLAVTH